MDPIEKAKMLIHTPDPDTGAVHSADVTTIYGTAASDSANGAVMIDLGSMTISGNGEQTIEVPTTVDVRKGDQVKVELAGADGGAKAITVTGVVGGGDRTKEEVGAVIVRVQETEEGLESKVSKGGIISAINQTPESVTIDAEKINLDGAVIVDGTLKNSSGTFSVNKDGDIKGADITGSSMHVLSGEKVEDISGFYAESSDKNHKNGLTAFGMYGTYSSTFQGSTYNGKGMFTPEVITLSYGKSWSAEEYSASIEPGEISTTTTDSNGQDISSSMSGYEIVQAGHGFRGEDLTESVKGNLGPNTTAGKVGSFFSVVRIGQLVICSLNIQMKKNSTTKLGIIYGLPKAAYPANGTLSYNGYSSSVNIFIRAGETIIYNDGTIPYDGFVEGQLIYITSE